MLNLKLSKEFLAYLCENDCSLTLDPYKEGLQFGIIGDDGKIGYSWGLEWTELEKLPASYIESTIREAIQLDRHKWRKGGRYAA